MGSEAIQTWDLGINYVDDDISKGALWMDCVGWRSMEEWDLRKGVLGKGSFIMFC